MNDTKLDILEQECEAAYTKPNQVMQSPTLKQLVDPTEVSILETARMLLSHSTNLYAQQMGMHCFSRFLTAKWDTVDSGVIASIQEYLISVVVKFADGKTRNDAVRLLAWTLHKQWCAECKLIKEQDDRDKFVLPAVMSLNTTTLASPSSVLFDVFTELIELFTKKRNDYTEVGSAVSARTALCEVILSDLLALALRNISGMMSSSAITLVHAILKSTWSLSDGEAEESSGHTYYSECKFYKNMLNEPSLYAEMVTAFQATGNVLFIQSLALISLQVDHFDQFDNDVRRKVYPSFVTCLLQLLQPNINAEMHHEVCRFAYLLFNNSHMQYYSLKEMKEEEKIAFFKTLCGFTINSFQMWKWAPHSVSYLISMWFHIFSSFSDKTAQSIFPSIKEQIITAYLQARLQDAEDDMMLGEKRFHREISHFSYIVCMKPKDSVPIVLKACNAASNEHQFMWMLYIFTRFFRDLQNCGERDEMATFMKDVANWACQLIQSVDFSRMSLVFNNIVLRFLRALHDTYVAMSSCCTKVMEDIASLPYFGGNKETILRFIAAQLSFFLEHCMVDNRLIKQTMQLLFPRRDIGMGETAPLIKLDNGALLPKLVKLYGEVFDRQVSISKELYASRIKLSTSILRSLCNKKKQKRERAAFFATFDAKITMLCGSANLQPASTLIIGLLLDLRGLAEAQGSTTLITSYFYFWLLSSDTMLPFLLSLVDVFQADLTVLSPLFKFLAALVRNYPMRSEVNTGRDPKMSWFALFRMVTPCIRRCLDIMNLQESTGSHTKMLCWASDLWDAFAIQHIEMAAIRFYEPVNYTTMMKIGLEIVSTMKPGPLYANFKLALFNLDTMDLLAQTGDPLVMHCAVLDHYLKHILYNTKKNTGDQGLRLLKCRSVLSRLLSYNRKQPTPSVTRFDGFYYPLLYQAFHVDLDNGFTTNQRIINKQMYYVGAMFMATSSYQEACHAIDTVAPMSTTPSSEKLKRWLLHMLDAAQRNMTYSEFNATVINDNSPDGYTIKGLENVVMQ